MNKKNFLLLTVLIFFSIIDVYSQSTYKGLPDDLDKEKIVFLIYDKLSIPPDSKRFIKGLYKDRNKLIIRTNNSLGLYAQQYPFKYKISSRLKYIDLIEDGYKYVLENDMMIGYNNNCNMFAGFDEVYLSPMYIKDLISGDKYILFSMSQKHCFNYKGIMRKFSRIVKRHYKWINRRRLIKR